VEYEGIQSRTLSFQYPEYHITGSTLEEEAISYGVNPDTALILAGLEEGDLKIRSGSLGEN
jgi:hypothetical protein